MKNLAIIVSGMLLLSACNGNREPGTAQAAAPVTTDTFTTQVQSQAATTQEDTEPQDISMAAVKTPEDTEPVALN